MTTLQDIADKCGVSPSTVSLVLNKPNKISLPVRQKVYEAIVSEGYFKTNSDRIKQLGILCTNFKSYYFDTFYNEVLFGVLNKLAELKINARFLDGFDVEYSDIHDLQGLILIGKMPDHYLQKISKFKFPCVLAGHPSPKHPDLPTIYAERKEGTQQIVELLQSCGHQNIAVLTAEQDQGDIVLWQEFIETIEKGYPDFNEDHVFYADYNNTNTVEVAWNKIMSLKPKVTAVICGDDLLAYMAYKAAHKYEINIPNDISITGYDGLHFPAHIDTPEPKLTTVWMDRAKLGRQSVELLYSKLLNLPNLNKRIAIPGELRIGDSVKRV